MSIHPNGAINPCCVTTDVHKLGNIKDISLKEAWNAEAMKNIRKDMLQNKMPKACTTCFKKEKYGLESDRLRANRFNPEYRSLTQETEADGSLKDLKLKSLDIRFSNHCNLSCRICRPIASTGWYMDAKLLGYKHIDLSKKITPTPGNKRLMEQVMLVLKDLEKIFFVGGEPLLQKEHYEVLDELLKNGNTNILLDYISNFTELTFARRSVIEYWKKFKRVSLTISLDGIKERGELLRKGFRWERFLQNLETVRKETPHVDILVSPTISIHNAFHLPELIDCLLSELRFEISTISLNPLKQPSYYSVQALPAEEKERLKLFYQKYLSKKKKDLAGETYFEVSKQLNAIVNFMEEEDLSEKFPYFLDMTKRLDIIRGENFQKTFPEFKAY